MEVLMVVHKNAAERASVELVATKSELEVEHHNVISLEFQLAGEQKKLGEAQRACTTAHERWDEAMSSNEDLVKDKEEADNRIAALEKELAEERTKLAFERRRTPTCVWRRWNNSRGSPTSRWP
ncbi:hypothetical protein CsSME_00019869 [Camellia sinensis var. sinensis]